MNIRTSYDKTFKSRLITSILFQQCRKSEKQFSSSSRRRAKASSSSGAQFLPLPFFTFEKYVCEIVIIKNLTAFESCHFPQFYIILIRLSFLNIETKNFNSQPHFFNLVKLGTISPAVYFINCVHIGESQRMAAIILGLSSGKYFLNLKRRLLRSLNYKQGKKIYRGALKSRYWSLFVLLLLRPYTCILEVRENTFYFHFCYMVILSLINLIKR